MRPPLLDTGGASRKLTSALRLLPTPFHTNNEQLCVQRVLRPKADVGCGKMAKSVGINFDVRWNSQQ